MSHPRPPQAETGHGKKLSIYLHADIFNGIQAEAARMDRSLSWVVSRAWQVARKELAKLPGAEKP